MKFIKETVFLGIMMTIVGTVFPAQASSQIVSAELEPESSWHLQARGGVTMGSLAHRLNCPHCGRVQTDAGLVMGIDALYKTSNDLWVGISGDFSPLIFGPEQGYSGLLLGQTKDLGFLKTSVFAEAGLHGVHRFASDLFENSARDSDWAILPYAGARVNADIVLSRSIGLNLGIWSSLRMDLMQRQQKILMDEFTIFGDDQPTMRTYRVGGLQAAGGFQVSMAI